MPSRKTPQLSRRERQLLDLLYERGPLSAAEVHEALPDAPSYSSVRALLRVLEEKGHVRHKQDGPRYLWLPRVSRERASRNALEDLVRTFFDGSTDTAVAALLDLEDGGLSPEAVERILAQIERARREGR